MRSLTNVPNWYALDFLLISAIFHPEESHYDPKQAKAEAWVFAQQGR